MKVLVVDIGGTNVKCLTSAQPEPQEFHSGPKMTPGQMVSGVQKITRGWKYDVVSIGYPGPCIRGLPAADPINLGPGWLRFDLRPA